MICLRIFKIPFYVYICSCTKMVQFSDWLHQVNNSLHSLLSIYFNITVYLRNFFHFNIYFLNDCIAFQRIYFSVIELILVELYIVSIWLSLQAILSLVYLYVIFKKKYTELYFYGRSFLHWMYLICFSEK